MCEHCNTIHTKILTFTVDDTQTHTHVHTHTHMCTHTHTQAAGKYRQQGRNYTVEDGDIIFFKFNAGAGLTSGKKK